MDKDYELKSIKDVKNCKHINCHFWGHYSLVGYYYCDDCKSKFDPQEYQRYEYSELYCRNQILKRVLSGQV